MTTGRILRFDEVRGYGFIAPDEGGEDVFMHANDLLDDKHLFQAGVVVAFDVEDSGRGLKASNISIASSADAPAAEPAVVPPAPRADEPGDTVSAARFRGEITETLLAAAPTLTAAQIVQLRRQLVQLAQDHGWVEPG
ncbi:cold-shock protein [Amycolatopsis suaedae]|uniref:Cold shock domain-containing protein n=1 Tax=Amycolatopsis suaedae TaxID=2510978 RepID=A0A4V2EMD6_9PSEU|nr:cold shock domain-containing protein [Amycolatopsis suaedae]RZQ64695.1 cold shock domain-containing protein [Amycolatopsis suaedae]